MEFKVEPTPNDSRANQNCPLCYGKGKRWVMIQDDPDERHTVTCGCVGRAKGQEQ